MLKEWVRDFCKGEEYASTKGKKYFRLDSAEDNKIWNDTIHRNIRESIC